MLTRRKMTLKQYFSSAQNDVSEIPSPKRKKKNSKGKCSKKSKNNTISSDNATLMPSIAVSKNMTHYQNLK